MLKPLRSCLALAPLLIFITASGGDALHLNATQTKPFPLELDHVFVWVTKGAPEAQALQQAGLQLQPDTHPHTGQGTASKIFIFENVYLELIWIEDEQAATKNAARSGIDMLRRSRWKQTGASPFGVGLHRKSAESGELPFPVRLYWAEWMKPDTTIEFAQTVSNATEPMYFVLPDYISIGSPAVQARLKETVKSSPHQLGVSRLTDLRIITTSNRLTSTSEMLTRGGVVKVERGSAPLAQLTFDGGRQGKSVDLRPGLPLVLKY